MSYSLLALLVTLACLAFAAMVLRQFALRRRPYQAIWALGLLAYGVAAGAELVGYGWGWSDALYRLWYATGAIAVAAVLGLGEVYLLRATRFGYLVALGIAAGAIPAFFAGVALTRAGDPDATAVTAVAVNGLVGALVLAAVQARRPEDAAHAAAAILGVGLLVAWRQVLAAPIDHVAMVDPATGIVVGRGFPERVRLITPLFNIAGAAALVLGALYSAWQLWRRHTQPRRVVSNLVIAAGAFAPSLSNTLSRLGISGAYFIGELLGVTVIFAGFLISADVFARRGAPTPPPAALTATPLAPGSKKSL